jgi:hypothetical protein
VDRSTVQPGAFIGIGVSVDELERVGIPSVAVGL